MSKIFLAATLCAGLGAFLLTPTARGEFPIRGDVKFAVNFTTAPSNGCNGRYGSGFGGNGLPWYLYFPVDPYANMGQGVPPNRFPNWPGCFPPPDGAQCFPGGAPLCPNPGAMSRRFPDWPAPASVPAGIQSQYTSYGQAPAGNVIQTVGTSSYAPNWLAAPMYPVAWQQGYYYGR
jgi:hypothetical protein